MQSGEEEPELLDLKKSNLILDLPSAWINDFEDFSSRNF